MAGRLQCTGASSAQTACDGGKAEGAGGGRHQQEDAATAVKTKAKKQWRGVVVLLLFDGVCCGLLALHRAGIAVRAYWRVENDHWCNVVAEKFSEARLCGTMDVEQLVGDEVGPGYPTWGEVGLIVYGFPCQGVSRANVRGMGLADHRSGLLLHAIRLTKMVEAVAVKVVKLVECVARWNKSQYLGRTPRSF